MSKDNLHRKVKIDYSVLRELLSIYPWPDGTNMVVEYGLENALKRDKS